MNEQHFNNVISKLGVELANKSIELANLKATVEELQQQINENNKVRQEQPQAQEA